MPNNKKTFMSKTSISVSDSISSTVLNFDSQTALNSANGMLFYVTNKGLYNYVEFIKSKADEDMKRESLYITAIRNLRKKIRFMNLNFDYQNDFITEDEFQKELNEHQDKYFINVSLLSDKFELDCITKIVNNIDDDLTIDDIADIFSIDINSQPKLIEA
jgi:hypothetical protein